jgi:hypothetical protein
MSFIITQLYSSLLLYPCSPKGEGVYCFTSVPTIWGTYMKLVTKYQISAINSCWEKCDEKCAYMFNVYKNQLSRQTGSRNHITLTSFSWSIDFLEFTTNFYTPAPRRGKGVYCFTSVRLSVLPFVQDIFRRIFLSNCWWQKSDINQQSQQTGSRNLMGPKTLPTTWGTYMKLVTKYQISAINVAFF